MLTYREYLDSLNEKSVWLFTKQKVTNFEQIVNSVRLFAAIPDRENTNIEHFFTEHHDDYNVETDRHRTLVIPQFFGLLTKTPFYDRGASYNSEKPTEVYDYINSLDPEKDKDKYGSAISEQLLKLKIHAIIDTSGNNEDYFILPIIFIFKVLKELKDKFAIRDVAIDSLYTYVMTCKKYSDWKNAVRFISENAPPCEYVKQYANNSRILALIRNNTDLFKITRSSISLSEDFEEYFQHNFMLKYDIEEFHEILHREVDYSYFLYNYQNFNVNILDSSSITCEKSDEEPCKAIEVIETEQNEENDSNYLDKINKIRDNNVNTAVATGAWLIEPTFTINKQGKKKYKRNPLLGKIAIQNSYYACENNHEHQTFISKATSNIYMEAHHLVPVNAQEDIWNKYHINVDCIENIVSLCPTCHRAFHHGNDDVKRKIIDNIYQHIVPRYRSIGFDITLEEIYKLYDIDIHYEIVSI